LTAGATRIFGSGSPNAEPSDSCIEIFAVGANEVPDNPPGSVDDQLIGTGGTDAAGNFVDASDLPGIVLSRPLLPSDRVFVFDACNDLAGATVLVRTPVPLLSPALLIIFAGGLGLFGFFRLSRRLRSVR
jgi:hypothetical protein